MADLFDRVKAALADRYAFEPRLGVGGMDGASVPFDRAATRGGDIWLLEEAP